MLVLSAKKTHRILIGEDIVVTVCELEGGSVRLGFEAPKSVRILREEVAKRNEETDGQQQG